MKTLFAPLVSIPRMLLMKLFLVGVGKSNGEIKLYDHETQKLASILKKSRNPNLFDGHLNKVRRIDISAGFRKTNLAGIKEPLLTSGTAMDFLPEPSYRKTS